MEILRLTLYGITAICCGALAYRLYPVRNTLARMFATLLLTTAINALALLSILLLKMLGGDPGRLAAQFTFTISALLVAAVSVGLLLFFFNETRNGRGP